MKIVHGTNPHDAHPRVRFSNAKHECTTGRAEMVGHHFAGSDRFLLAELCEVLAAANVLDVCVGNGKVRCEHGCSELAAVGAVADESVN